MACWLYFNKQQVWFFFFFIEKEISYILDMKKYDLWTSVFVVWKTLYTSWIFVYLLSNLMVNIFPCLTFFLSNGHVGFLVKVSNDLKLVFLLFPKCLSENNSFASKTPILPSLCFLNFLHFYEFCVILWKENSLPSFRPPWIPALPLNSSQSLSFLISKTII